MARVPIVDHLVLEPSPHLVAQACDACGARFFGRRNGCAACGATAFSPVAVATEGTVTSFTIVTFAAPGIDVPFTAAIVDCDGTTVQANLINVPADVDHVRLGMPVRLATWSLGADSAGDEGVAFGFEPTDAAGETAA